MKRLTIIGLLGLTLVAACGSSATPQEEYIAWTRENSPESLSDQTDEQIEQEAIEFCDSLLTTMGVDGFMAMGAVLSENPDSDDIEMVRTGVELAAKAYCPEAFDVKGNAGDSVAETYSEIGEGLN